MLFEWKGWNLFFAKKFNLIQFGFLMYCKINFLKNSEKTYTYYFCNLLTLESGIDVGQEISVGPGKFDKNNPKILPKLKINK